jgi:peptidoglycan L-alanyl-D-glutamate endopeptidase CwlK
MTFTLGNKSRLELQGVHPSLVAVVERAIQLTDQDFSVHDGLRTEAEQREYVKRGVSKTMNSMHRKQPDGFGHAVDLVPWVNGKLRWEWKPIYVIASAVHKAATELDVLLIWGGCWDRDFTILPNTPEGLQGAVNSYVARRRGVGKNAFIDGPHYQLKGGI